MSARRKAAAPAWPSFVSENPWYAESERLLTAWKTAQAASMRSMEARNAAWQAFFAHPTTAKHRTATKATDRDDKCFEAQETAWAAYLAHSKGHP